MDERWHEENFDTISAAWRESLRLADQGRFIGAAIEARVACSMSDMTAPDVPEPLREAAAQSTC